MSQTYEISEDAAVVTPLARQLSSGGPAPELEMRRGAQTPLRFTEPAAELRELIEGAGIFDLGYRTFLRAVGKDRVRWLNGMITQAVKSMTPGQTGYTLILNPQGRIQGDGDVYSFDDFLGDKETVWDGVTNPTAVKYLRELKAGTKWIFYHTGDERTAVGTGTVVSVDPTDPKVPVVKVKVGKRLKTPKTLAAIKAEPLFAESPLVIIGRLSVVPLTEDQWHWFLD